MITANEKAENAVKIERAINVSNLYDTADDMENERRAAKRRFERIENILHFIDDVREESEISAEELAEAREMFFKLCEFAEKARVKAGDIKARTIRDAEKDIRDAEKAIREAKK